jgi:hypothetical protein
MQNVNKQLGNGSIIHRCSYYKHILVINKVQTYSNVLTIPVKMFFNHLTAWLKPHSKKTLNRIKKFKTRLMVQNLKKKQALDIVVRLEDPSLLFVKVNNIYNWLCNVITAINSGGISSSQMKVDIAVPTQMAEQGSGEGVVNA